MRPILTFLLMLLFGSSWAQLNCDTKKAASLGTVTTCMHINGKASTVETWDAEKRWGKMIGYNNEGKEIFNYQLRKVGGHASVYLSYHKNGQVSKAEFSSAPDGGIQFTRIISEYDEAGTRTNYMDLSRPDGKLESPSFIEQEKPKVFKQEIVEEGVMTTTVFQLVNETKHYVFVRIVATPGNQYWGLRTMTVELKPKQKLPLDSITLTSKFLSKEEGLIVEIDKKQKKKKKFKYIFANPLETVNRKVYTWHIIEE